MIIFKRAAGAVMVMLCFIILSPLFGAAGGNSSVEWEIKAYDDHSIQETVIVNDGEIKAGPGWEKSVSGGKNAWTRKVDNWSAYNALDDRLPIEAHSKNFLLWQKTSLWVTADQAAAEGLFSQIKNGEQDISIIISIPGYISDTSGSRSSEMSATWQFDNAGTLNEGEFMLKAIVFDGLWLGITGFALGLIIIGIVYIRRMKKIEKMMEEEYSLENIDLESLEEQEQNQDDNGAWI